MLLQGVGIDVEDSDRFKSKVLSRAFLNNKVFTDVELAYCRAKKDSALHLAMRFAAKEAVYKSICSYGLEPPVSLKKIEVSNLLNGVPTVKLNSEDYKNIKLHLSMASSGGVVVAFAVAEKI